MAFLCSKPRIHYRPHRVDRWPWGSESELDLVTALGRFSQRAESGRNLWCEFQSLSLCGWGFVSAMSLIVLVEKI